MDSKQRTRAPKKERTTNPLADLGIFNIPDLDVMDDDNESNIDESALESEVEAILSGKAVSKPPRPKNKDIMKKASERSSRVTRGSSGNRQPGQSSSAKKRKCPADDKSPAKRNNAPDPMPKVQRRQFGDGKLYDAYCWICHKFADDFYCPDCPRVYHNDCLRKLKSNPDEPLCKCKWTSVDGLTSHNVHVTSSISEDLSLALHEVIKDIKNKKLQTEASEYVKLLIAWPEECENHSICDIWDIKLLIDKIHCSSYKNTGMFFQDVKWIYHNCYITFGPDHEMTTTALKFEKAMKQQLSDMEACGECYREKCARFPQVDFFSKVCSNPHLIVWAKLRGFPFWPAKCLRIVNGRADVRFFGTHDKSLIPLAQVFKISLRNPGGNPKKPKNSSRTTSYYEAMTELSLYIKNFEKKCGVFQYFNEKTLLEPVKKSGKRMRPNKNGSQLEVSMDVDAALSNYRERSHNRKLPVSEPSDALPPTVTTRGSSSSIPISSVTKESSNNLTSSPLDPSLLKSPPSLPASAATSSPLMNGAESSEHDTLDPAVATLMKYYIPPTTTSGLFPPIRVSSDGIPETPPPLHPGLFKSPASLPAKPPNPSLPTTTYVLHESTSFIDGLISQPVAPIKKKKKTPPKAAATTPTSPPIAAPKLQFYKDTLEEKMSENKAEEPEHKADEIQKTEDISENSPTIPEDTVPMKVIEEGRHTPPNEEIVGNQSPDQESDFMDYEDDAIENFVRSVNQDMVKKMKAFIEYLTQDEEEEEGDEEGETFEIDNYAKEKCRELVFVLKYLIDFATVAHN